MSYQHLRAIVTAPKRIVLEHWTPPDPLPGEVRIRVEQWGVCDTDIERWRDGGVWLPAAIGHEFAGVVVAAGEDVHTPAPGDRVVAWVPSGAFADEAIAKASHCFPVERRVPYPVAAEPLGRVVKLVKGAAPKAGDHTVIVGGGFMALLTVMLIARQKQPGSIIFASRRAEARNLASRVGATHVTTYRSLQDVVDKVTNGIGADLMYRFTEDAGLDTVGVTHGTGAIVVGRIYEYQPILPGIGEATQLLTDWTIDPTPLIGARFPLRSVAKAFRAAARGDGKVVVVPDA